MSEETQPVPAEVAQADRQHERELHESLLVDMSAPMDVPSVIKSSEQVFASGMKGCLDALIEVDFGNERFWIRAPMNVG